MRNVDDVLLRRGVITRPVGFDYRNMKEEKWMTRDEAVTWLTVWREQNVPKHNLYFPITIKRSITSGVENVYLNGMIDELIERVRESNEDPITAVAEYYYEMDEILATSDDDHYITHRFAGYMERASYDVLIFLKEKEKEMNRK